MRRGGGECYQVIKLCVTAKTSSHLHLLCDNFHFIFHSHASSSSFLFPLTHSRKHLIVHFPRCGNNKGSFPPSSFTSFYYFHLLKYAIQTAFSLALWGGGRQWKNERNEERLRAIGMLHVLLLTWNLLEVC
jgi:hypothetical protein